MSTCVVKDIEFMNTSKRLGVHPDNLELIVHEFINKEGNEGSFPTDSYIKEALSGKPFEASRGAIKLWERRYSTPKTFRNLAELQRAVSKAEKFFPREAIGTYRTNDNKYVMQVGTPLLKNPTQSRVDQIVTHLRLSGIPVHGRRGMIRYIRENGLDNVQQEANRLYQMFIGKKARANFEQTLRNKRPDMSNEEIKSTLDFLHSLEDNKENTAYIKAAIKWVANRSITLPQDNTKAKQVFSEARKRHIDVMKYNTLGELIASDEMKPKEKEKPKFDPDKAKTFSNKRTVTTEEGRVFTVYDVENNWEGQREVCKALAAHYKVSPWCLSTFTATGEPTQSAKKYWNIYSGVKRRIAYEDGKPVAFSSDQGTADQENEINNYVDDLANRLLKDQLSEQEQVDLEKAIDELASSNESQITTTPEHVKEFIDKNPELYKEFEKEWSHAYTINGKENEILKMLLLGHSESVSNFMFGYKDEAFTLGDSGEFGFTWALCQELPETSLANNIEGENELSDREAWWDMEDVHPMSELDDSIMNERMLSEREDRIAAELNETMHVDLPWFKTPSGEIYGFVTPEGEMYLDTRVINEEHPIHEYTHLWDKAVQDRNPGLWLRGVALMKQIPLWNEIANSNQYGAKWRESGITEDKLTNLIASEVHARLVGKEGAEIIRNLAKEKGNKGIVAKLKQWLLDFWRELKGTFGTWNNKELSNLTLEQFNMMTVRDFAEGVPLNDITLSNGLTYTQLLNIQREMEAIRQQAIADGTFMKAPNGQPTKLTERQWLQVRTKAFKEWFGDWEKAITKELPKGYAYRYITGNELDDILSTNKLREIPEGKERPSREVMSKSGRRFRIGKVHGNSHNGKGFSKDIDWRTEGTVSSGLLHPGEKEYIIGIPLSNTKWKEGHHGSYSDYKNAEDIESGRPLFLPFNDKGEVDISLNGMIIYETSGNRKEGFLYKKVNDPDVSKVVDENGEPKVLTNKQVWAINPNQIKSATGNVGTFSRTNDNIQMYIENGENENARALENAYVEHQKKVEAQVNNLLDSEAISATELRHVADQVAWLISDHITDLQTKEGYSEKLYGIKKEDFGSLS